MEPSDSFVDIGHLVDKQSAISVAISQWERKKKVESDILMHIDFLKTKTISICHYEL